jgi:hypothetical protein
MPPGDAQRDWFPEMLFELEEFNPEDWQWDLQT